MLKYDITVIGCLIDDLLFCSHPGQSESDFQSDLDRADAIMTILGVPPNDKGQGPAHALTFCGLIVDSAAGQIKVSDEHAAYCLERLDAVVVSSKARATALAWLTRVDPLRRTRGSSTPRRHRRGLQKLRRLGCPIPRPHHTTPVVDPRPF